MKKAVAIASLISGLPLLTNAETLNVTTQITSAVAATNSVYINLAVASSACTNGQSPKRFHIFENSTDNAFKQRMFAIALSAVSMGRDVKVWFDEGSSNCSVTRISLEDM
jgi:hypothetical protein